MLGTVLNEKFIKSVAFLLIGCFLFLCVQNLMVPEYIDSEDMERRLNGFDVLEENSLDVLFVGASTFISGVQPMEMYEDHQFLSYNLASSAQPIECSYFMTKNAFQTQSPRLVVLDASGLFPSNYSAEQRSGYWWYLLNLMPMSRLKLEMIREYGEKQYTDGKLAAVLPILKYHTRWSALTRRDFKIVKKSSHYAAGGFFWPLVVPAGLSSPEALNEIVSLMMEHNTGGYRYYDGGSTGGVTAESPVYDPQITQEGQEFLLKLKQLCEEHGAQLALAAIPTIYWPMFGSAWTEVKSQRVKQLANELALPFYDLMYDYDTGVDFLTDSMDGGIHLNVCGDIKTAKVLGDILSGTYQFMPHTDALYDEMSTLYQKVREIALLETEMDFTSYIEYLADQLDKWTVFISVYEEYTAGMTAEDYDFLEQRLGLQHISEGTYCDSYMAVIHGREVLYEAVGDSRIDHSMTVDGVPVFLTSAGWYNRSFVSINISGIEYAYGARGLNIVVYDNASGRVIDSVVFDTGTESKPAMKNGPKVNDLLRAYETQVCYGGNKGEMAR